MIGTGIIMVKTLCLFFAVIAMLAECIGWGWFLLVAVMI